VRTSWGRRLGNARHEVAATGRNCVMRSHEALVARGPDHRAEVAVAGSTPVVRSKKEQVRGIIRVRA
jgi:hypothetical protein